jgi:prepilin-type N-terminal cleavage/methylation domain-containing protein
MTRTTRTTGTAQARRAGFTLVELVVVIGIILALIALSASASMRLIATQKGSVTETTITKVDSALRKQWDAVIRAANNEDIATKIGANVYNNTFLPAAGNDPHRARLIYIKLRLKQEFPINYAEIFKLPAGYPLPAKQSYVKYLQTRNVTAGSAGGTPAAHESSACLLMALREGRSGGTAGADDFGATSVDMVGQVEVLVDGWRKPLAFYRWPTDNAEVDGLGPPNTTTVRDPEDPDGQLMAPSWWGLHRVTFEGWCHSLHKGSNTRYAYYTTPVIASWGPNGRSGLANFTTAPAPNPMTPATGAAAADANDNIYNYRLRRLGARGD